VDSTYLKEYTSNDKGIVVTQLRVTLYAIKKNLLKHSAFIFTITSFSRIDFIFPSYVLILKNRHYESIQTYINKAIVNLEIANQRVERWEHEMWKNLVGSSRGVDLSSSCLNFSTSEVRV